MKKAFANNISLFACFFCIKILTTHISSSKSTIDRREANHLWLNHTRRAQQLLMLMKFSIKVFFLAPIFFVVFFSFTACVLSIFFSPKICSEAFISLSLKIVRCTLNSFDVGQSITGHKKKFRGFMECFWLQFIN